MTIWIITYVREDKWKVSSVTPHYSKFVHPLSSKICFLCMFFGDLNHTGRGFAQDGLFRIWRRPTMTGQRLYQVTWLKQTGFVYDCYNLNKLGEFTHQMQDGWKLATDGQVLFGSDGTSTLYHIDSQTLKVIKKHTIKYKEHEVHNLNVLEYINGESWANV